MIIGRPDWQDDAACAGKPGDWWFPNLPRPGKPGWGPRIPQYDRARQVCAGCEVRKECREYAMRLPNFGHDHGMWGGLEPRQIIEKRRERRAIRPI